VCCHARGACVLLLLGTGVFCYARGRVCVSYLRRGSGRTVIQKGRPSCALHVVYLEWLKLSACSRLRLWKILQRETINVWGASKIPPY
jgi:hypothetical protein